MNLHQGPVTADPVDLLNLGGCLVSLGDEPDEVIVLLGYIITTLHTIVDRGVQGDLILVVGEHHLVGERVYEQLIATHGVTQNMNYNSRVCYNPVRQNYSLSCSVIREKLLVPRAGTD